MNIKSLLLGSAAALVAVSGARAADAVVMVEPEPAEYVRICDTYGTGFFYIPGTETCLKIGGYVRMRVNAANNYTGTDLEEFDGAFDSDDSGMTTNVRARLDFDAREETELGMLRAKIRVQATNEGNGFNTNDADYRMDEAFLQLGGLTAGYLDSLWAERDGLFTDNDWSAGDYQQNRISYTFAVAGFTAAVSLEDDGTSDFVPDVVAQLAYEGGWGEAYVTGVFDEESFSSAYNDGSFAGFFTDTVGVLTAGDFVYAADGYTADDSAFALKAGVTLKDLLATGSQFKVEGHYAFDPTEYATVDYVFSGNGYGNENILRGSLGAGFTPPSEWQVGAGYQQEFGKLFAAISGVYGETFDYNATTVVPVVGGLGFATSEIGGAEYWGAAVNVGYEITSNFSVLGEVSYRDVDVPDEVTSGDADLVGGFIELKRTF